ncbi:MAG: DNA mismatch repair protein MutS, partial [Clostridia bacterium]|nr:DNA mismatch repair protein MutS [Clostridia bacterium]
MEVSKSQTSQVPFRYVRRQTLTTGERYITEELKDLESKILNADEYAKSREIALFESVVAKIKTAVEDIIAVAKCVANLDCLLSNFVVSTNFGYVKPEIGEHIKELKIVEGRHCVVEKLIGRESFVPNDTFLDEKDNRSMLITGPNMAGKSIYMRQVALIVIMAYTGCYVPAQSAKICYIDKIFTRVGASDDLSTGRSTFMVEMSEVANIIDNATDNSLLLLDEIGRGTATFDGLSIAWAIIDYLSTNTKAKTLFSTHYHELTELEGVYEGLKNYKMTVREYRGEIIFMRKLLRGSANKSFGIEVAGLAGLPQSVLLKAKELLKKLEKSDIARK